MREIKFRAWDTEAELWRYFTLGDVIAGKMVRFAHCISNTSENTGLHDKNGKEIYEGDILNDLAHEMTSKAVTFDDGGFYAWWRYTEPGDRRKDAFAGGYLRIDNTERYEVIGNIYEESHLIA